MADEKKNALGNEEITELVFILDRSGSMGGLEDDTIGGYNSVLAEHKKAEGQATVSTVLFDHEMETLHDRLDIADVAPLTRNDYSVRGCTALLDAMGKTIKHIEQVQKYMPEDHKAGHVIFVVTTDGMENASKEFGASEVKNLVSQKQELGWEFFFLGANIDAVEEAGKLGIAEDRAVTYLADEFGTSVMYEAVACATSSARASKSRIGGSWKCAVEEDTAARG